MSNNTLINEEVSVMQQYYIQAKITEFATRGTCLIKKEAINGFKNRLDEVAAKYDYRLEDHEYYEFNAIA